MKKGNPKRCGYCDSPSSIVGSYQRKFFRTCKTCKSTGLKVENNWFWFRNVAEASVVLGPCSLRDDIKKNIVKESA